MLLSRFIRFALRSRFDLNVIPGRTARTEFTIEEKHLDPFAPKLDWESELVKIAESINLSGLEQIFGSTTGEKKGLQRIAKIFERDLLIEIDSFHKKHTELSKELITQTLLEQIIGSNKHVLELMVFYAKAKAAITEKDSQSSWSRLVFFSHYYSSVEFNKLPEAVTLSQLEIKTDDFETLMNTLTLLHHDTAYELIKKTADAHLSLLAPLNFHRLNLLPVENYKILLRQLADEKKSEISGKLFGTKKDFETALANLFCTAISERMILFYYIMDARLSQIRDFEWNKSIPEYLWDLHFSNYNRLEIYKTIVYLAPKIRENNDRRVFKERPKLPKNFQIYGDTSCFEKPITIDNDLYTQVYPDNLPRTEIGEVMIQIFLILHDPNTVVSILSPFEEELKEAWKKEFGEQHITQILPKTYTEYIEKMPWKIPLEESKFKTNRFLTRAILAFMRKRGFAQNVYKATFFLDEKSFMNIIETGDFFSESALSPYFLFHGKTIHNLGRVIVILAWELGLLPHKDKISIQDIFKALSDLTLTRSGYNIWSLLFDQGPRSDYSCSSPHLFNSLLMSACTKSLPYLSTLLTHSFCKDQYKLRDLLNAHNDLKLSVEEVIKYYVAPRVLHIIQDIGKQLTGKIQTQLDASNKLEACTQERLLYQYKADFDVPDKFSSKSSSSASNRLA